MLVTPEGTLKVVVPGLANVCTFDAAVDPPEDELLFLLHAQKVATRLMIATVPKIAVLIFPRILMWCISMRIQVFGSSNCIKNHDIGNSIYMIYAI
jgi:hypothetical protein